MITIKLESFSCCVSCRVYLKMGDMEMEVAPVSREASVIVVSESGSSTEEDVPMQVQGPSVRPRLSARRVLRRRHIGLME